MGDIVNLRRARKQAERKRGELIAAANRFAHGRNKTERALDQAKNDKARRDLDQRQIETGDKR
ncbi:MAG: DUF4169 family protein [Xanthobacteraceae bacterium]